MLRVLNLVIAIALLAACGGGGGGDGGEVPPTATGSLTVTTRCTIEVDESTCPVNVVWSSRDAATPQVRVNGAQAEAAASGEALIEVGHGTSVIDLADAAAVLASDTILTRCVGEADWDGTACRQVIDKIVEFAPTPFTEDGEQVFLEVVLYLPRTGGPYPTMMFNHGSTGFGADPALFGITYVSDTLVRFLTRRGWSVAFPQRRGRGQSGGLYDEGFTPNRSRYSCDPPIALAGAERALDDLDVALDWLLTYPGIDATRVITGGFSRGGVIAFVHGAERRPGAFLGVVNFVGGWMSDQCPNVDDINRVLFVRGAAFAGDSIWLYGERDQVYATSHSRANFDAFIAAGGTGTFFVYQREPDLNGHFVLNDLELWAADLDAFLATLP